MPTLRIAFALALFTAVVAAKLRPVVLMHGLFADHEAMSHIAQWLQADFPGIYVHNADVPTQNTTEGKASSLLIDLNVQLADLAAQLQADPELVDGFDLIGHSQGGLLTRTFIERYNQPRVHNYISLAGPQAGVFGVPDINDVCPDNSCPWGVDLVDSVANGGWLEPFVQSHISFAQYWRDPMNYSAYLQSSGFLADVNNERAAKNATYRENMLAITGNMTFVMALMDHIVVPKESAWWDFFALGQDVTVQTWTETPLYTEDRIGLKALNDAGRVQRLAVNCTHQGLPRPECKQFAYDQIIKPRVGGILSVAP